MTQSEQTTPGTPPFDDIRVGVYVCHCGGNISDVVDTKAVAEAVGQDPNVKIARDYVFMCSDPGQQLIIDDIIANNINRVVVAACSPSLHELTFRNALIRAGLNPYFYEHVNIREQVSWVHKGDHGGATAKAIRLTAAGVAKIVRQDALEPIEVDANGHVLVIGAGVAGLRAALTLAQRGLGVTVVEKNTAAGGRMAELDTVYPTAEKASELLAELTDAVTHNPKIELLTSTEVTAIDGFVGNFKIALSSQTEILAGSIIIATGFDHYQPYDGEFGYHTSPEVVTLPEFNQILRQHTSSGSQLKHNGRAIHDIAFIHCVGSRQVEGVHQPQPDGKVNDYCSRVCCTSTLHTIEQTLDRYPDVNIYDLYKDIRTYGRGHEEYYENASKKGVLFFRYNDDGLPQFEPGLNGKQASLKVTDWLTWGEEVTIPVDMVVLATGMMPRDISSIVSMLKLPIGADRFLQEVHPKLRPVELANNGVMIAGTCQGPMDINEACVAAGAAASKASILLSKPIIEIDPFVARVDIDKCDGCQLCLAECEYRGALTMVGDKASVNPAICVGCGACVAVCPPRAINIAGWTLEQFDAMIDAITTEEVPHA